MPDASPTPSTTIGGHYRTVRQRLTALASGLGPTELTAPVPACPGWSVHDVLAHLVGIVEDGLAGRLTGPPDEVQTAAQVARHRDEPTAALLATWAATAPAFEDVITGFEIWPALVDVLSHEHDVRGALDRPGGRTDATVVAVARRLVPDEGTIGVVLDGVELGPADARCRLRTTAFELLRVRLGRRSRTQTLALDWIGDPSRYVDDLFIFGPTTDAIIE